METSPLWTDLPEDVQSYLSLNAEALQFKRAEKVYHQGSQPRGLYFIEKGLVGLVLVEASSGKEHLTRFFKQGQFFGHRSLFANEEHHGEAVVLEATIIQFVSKEILFKILQQKPELYLGIVKFLSKELRRCEINQIRILENQILPRVAQTLVYLKDINPNHNWTRQEIANFCASTVSTVIKALSEIERLGYIEQDGRSINILDRVALISLQDS